MHTHTWQFNSRKHFVSYAFPFQNNHNKGTRIDEKANEQKEWERERESERARKRQTKIMSKPHYRHYPMLFGFIWYFAFKTMQSNRLLSLRFGRQRILFLLAPNSVRWLCRKQIDFGGKTTTKCFPQLKRIHACSRGRLLSRILLSLIGVSHSMLWYDGMRHRRR